MVTRYLDRFVAFASVALQFPEMAAEQLEEAVKKYNLRGAAMGGHVNGDELSNPKFDPFWKKAKELVCVVFMHPQGIPEMNKTAGGRRRSDERDRQSARDYDFPLASDSRRDVRPVPPA